MQVGTEKKTETPAQSVQSELTKKALESWGYAPRISGPEDFEQALIRFQHRHKIPATGEVSPETLALVGSRFCGCSDRMGAPHRVVSSAYSAGCKWPKKDLTYRHVSFNPALPQAELQKTFRSACDAWEKVCGLKFTEVASSARSDINVGWERIDGQGGTLAYAYLPGSCGGAYAGTLRFDLGDRWQVGDGGSLWQTAVHELGHIIGFYHSDRRDSIMWPYSGGGGTKISADDAAGAVSLYGPPRAGTPAPGPTPTPTPEPEALDFVVVAEKTGKLSRSDDSAFFVIKASQVAKARAGGFSSFSVTLEAAGSGDADIYSRWGEAPKVSGDLDASDVYDHGSWTPGGSEKYVVTLDQAKDLFFQVHAYTTQSGLDFRIRIQAQ